MVPVHEVKVTKGHQPTDCWSFWLIPYFLHRNNIWPPQKTLNPLFWKDSSWSAPNIKQLHLRARSMRPEGCIKAKNGQQTSIPEYLKSKWSVSRARKQSCNISLPVLLNSCAMWKMTEDKLKTSRSPFFSRERKLHFLITEKCNEWVSRREKKEVRRKRGWFLTDAPVGEWQRLI